MTHYYLWRGVDAIEDLEDCQTDEEARAALDAQTAGHWTLWKRTDRKDVGAVFIPQATLLGVKLCDLGETHHYNVP